jgi:hypothetical protein
VTSVPNLVKTDLFCICYKKKCENLRCVIRDVVTSDNIYIKTTVQERKYEVSYILYLQNLPQFIQGGHLIITHIKHIFVSIQQATEDCYRCCFIFRTILYFGQYIYTLTVKHVCTSVPLEFITQNKRFWNNIQKMTYCLTTNQD